MRILWGVMALFAACGGSQHKSATPAGHAPASEAEALRAGEGEERLQPMRNSADEVHRIAGKPPDRPTLMRWIAAGAPGFDEPCFIALLWGPVDAELASAHLHRALTAAVKDPLTAGACRRSVAAARLLRALRLGKLDLAADLAHTSPTVRAVALVHARHAAKRELLPTVLLHTSDPDPVVRREACQSAWWLGDSRACGGIPASGPPPARPSADVVAAAELAASERCRDANEAIATWQRDELTSSLFHLLGEAFSRLGQRYASDDDSSDAPALPRCRVTEAARKRVLENPDATSPVKALLAATLLWDAHPDALVR